MFTGRSGYEIRSASRYQTLWKSVKPLWNSRSCSIFKTTTICHFEISKVGRFVLRAVAPKISCWSAEAAVGQRDVTLTCSLVARPSLTSLFSTDRVLLSSVLILVLQDDLGYTTARLSLHRITALHHFLVRLTASPYKCQNGC